MAADDRAPHGHVLQPSGSDRERIVIQDGEVRKFAALDATNQVIELQCVGGADRDRSEGLLDAESFRLGPELAA